MNENSCDPIVIERQLQDGRLVEVLDKGTVAIVRVHAPSGKIYIEQEFRDVGAATAAITVWDGEGWPRIPPVQNERIRG